ncbi:Uncharacterised protein [Chlamydia trachomatis]|nr:Uncharacterised protein [Chlamydia trachomatis]
MIQIVSPEKQSLLNKKIQVTSRGKGNKKKYLIEYKPLYFNILEPLTTLKDFS